jgi:malate synthase
MEDAATAEISRTQVWQWIRHGAALEDGRKVTPALLNAIVEEEQRTIAAEIGAERVAAGRFPEATALFTQLAAARELAEFLTLGAYDLLEGDDS